MKWRSISGENLAQDSRFWHCVGHHAGAGRCPDQAYWMVTPVQQLALGLVKTPAGKMRRMRYHEMLQLARGICEAQGLGYSIREVIGEVLDARGTRRINARKQARTASQRGGDAPGLEVPLVQGPDDAGATVRKRHRLSANYGYLGPHVPH